MNSLKILVGTCKTLHSEKTQDECLTNSVNEIKSLGNLLEIIVLKKGWNH